MRIFMQAQNFNIENNINFRSKKTLIKTTENRVTTITKKVTDIKERNNAIAKMIEAGFTSEQITKALKITIETFYNAIKSLGIMTPFKKRNERILERLKNGGTIEKIAKDENVSTVVVRNIAIKAGIKPNTDIKVKKEKRNQLIQEMLFNGYTYNEIAQKLKVNISAVKLVASNESKPGKQFRDNRFLRIIEKFKQGLSFTQIAQEENLKLSTISIYHKKAIEKGLIEDINKRTNKYVNIEERNIDIIRKLKEGQTVQEVAQEEGLCIDMIKKIGRAAGVSLIYDAKKNRIERERIILKMLLDETSVSEIAKKFGINEMTVLRISQKYDVKNILFKRRVNRIQEKVKANKTYTEIAREEGLSNVTVAKYAKMKIS